MPLVARLCAERRVLDRECCNEWLAQSEAKLREANAAESTPDAALWLAARAWALAAARKEGAATSGAGTGERSVEGALATASQALALPGDLCSPGTVCAVLLGGSSHSTAKTSGSQCAWKAEFAVFCGQFIEVRHSCNPRLHDLRATGAGLREWPAGSFLLDSASHPEILPRLHVRSDRWMSIPRCRRQPPHAASPATQGANRRKRTVRLLLCQAISQPWELTGARQSKQRYLGLGARREIPVHVPSQGRFSLPP